MLIKDLEGQVSLFDPDSEFGKMCLGHTPVDARPARISSRSSKPSLELKNHSFMLLDLRPGAGGLLGPYWEIDPVWLGLPGTLDTSECPKGAEESFLSAILLDSVPSKYYLSRKACLGILRRAGERGKSLPPKLELALRIQAELLREERDNGEKLDIHRCLELEEEIKQEGEPGGSGWLTAGFCAGASPTAGNIGFGEELSPTLKAGESGTNMVPSVLCLNDQGGKVMECSENVSGTLRAQEHGHQPLVLFENHGVDARYTGPHTVAPTLSTQTGTDGNNLPIVAAEIFNRNRTDRFLPGEIASTESARQYKDATDLILEVAGLDCRNGKENGDLCGTLQPGTTGSSLNSIHPIRLGLLLRRLHPVECERLQGYPDFWTSLSGASDSSRYKSLGNSVCIPCVEYLMQGVGLAARLPYVYSGYDSFSLDFLVAVDE